MQTDVKTLAMLTNARKKKTHLPVRRRARAARKRESTNRRVLFCSLQTKLRTRGTERSLGVHNKVFNIVARIYGSSDRYLIQDGFEIAFKLLQRYSIGPSAFDCRLNRGILLPFS